VEAATDDAMNGGGEKPLSHFKNIVVMLFSQL
jgi:hypothetical protein